MTDTWPKTSPVFESTGEAYARLAEGGTAPEFREARLALDTMRRHGVAMTADIEAIEAALSNARRPSPPAEEQWEYGIEYSPYNEEFEGYDREHYERQVAGIRKGGGHYARTARVIRRRRAGESEPVE